jgi:dimethylhistidine N-methyltransferase
VIQTIERSAKTLARNPAFLKDVLSGLSRERKRLSCRFFYDEHGSRLFDEICELEEYYLTRTEMAIMQDQAGEMAEALGEGVRLVELGSGSSRKTRILLDRLSDPAAYLPVDISVEHLHKTVSALAKDYPLLEVLPVGADFCRAFVLPQARRFANRTVVYFPGSTIGNFRPRKASELLENIRNICGENGGLLLGVDLKKDASLLEHAYDDSQGVTAQFNLNLLRRMRRELDAELSEEAFEHVAFYNAKAGRVELYIKSLEEQAIRVAGKVFALRTGELIHTEDSHKYTVPEFTAMANRASFCLRKAWTDAKNYFAVLYFVARN